MKKYLLVIILLVSPLMGQEKKSNLYIETGIFTRIEGINNLDAYSPENNIISVSLTALEFSIGKDNIYLYTQFRFSTALPYWDYHDEKSFDNPYYGQRLGFLVGIGGKIYDSHPKNNSKKFTMHMNFGVGGDFSLNEYLTINNGYVEWDVVLRPYYTIELNWMMKYYFKKDFGMQWGFNLAMSGTAITTNENDYWYTPVIFIYNEWNIRYGFSFGFVF